MNQTSEQHKSSSAGISALVTDLYQLTMAQAYFDQGMVDTTASFTMSFRDNPFGGGYAVFAGLADVLDFLRDFHLDDDDIAYLKTLEAPQGGPLFHDGFLAYLRELEPRVSLASVAEGTFVFPREPLIRVSGPIIMCQLLECIILNIVNFQTLIATKAARVCDAAQGKPVMEFGLRRAQGPNGALMASRAAYLGGCVSTSHVLAGKVYGIPVAGTHAHAWVQAFDSEIEAFRAYAASSPKNCTLLVDTYDTMRGVMRAIEVAHEMEARGERLAAIRIDSGDLAELSKRARTMLDKSGLDYVKICVSNDLDEYTIQSLLGQGAPLDLFGVGTKLAVSYEQPALAGVYKLSALYDAQACTWTPKIKLSEQHYKLTIPGHLGVRRYVDQDGMPVGDQIYDITNPGSNCIIDAVDPTLMKRLDGCQAHDLLETYVEDGAFVKSAAHLAQARKYALAQKQLFSPTIRRFLNPEGYPCGLEEGLYERRRALVLALRNQTTHPHWK